MCLSRSGNLTNTIIILTDGQFFDYGGADKIIKDTQRKMNAKKAQLQVNTIFLGEKTYTDQMGTIAHAFLGTYMDITGTEMDKVERLLLAFYEKVFLDNNLYLKRAVLKRSRFVTIIMKFIEFVQFSSSKG